MADLKPDISFLKEIDPSGKLTNLIKLMLDSHNHVAQQTNASPVGTTPPPPKISGLTVTGAGSFHRISIQDSNPVTRGVHYHVEWDTSPQFTSPKQITLGPDRNLDIALGVKGPVYWRGYSSKLTSGPSDAVYFGTKSSPTGVDAGSLSVSVSGVIAGAATVTATVPVVGPTPLPSAGAGTEPSQFPQGSAGFGFEPERPGPRLPL